MVDPVQSPPKRKVLSLTPASLGIQSYYQMMIRVSNHPPKRFFEFRFHETILSFGVIGSLGIHLNTKKKHKKGHPCQCENLRSPQGISKRKKNAPGQWSLILLMAEIWLTTWDG